MHISLKMSTFVIDDKGNHHSPCITPDTLPDKNQSSMNGLDRKRIVRNSASNVNVLAEHLLKAVIAERISELKNYKESLREGQEKKDVIHKIEILQQPFEREFYQNIKEKTVKDITSKMLDVCENINLDVINAEYFDFSGRLR